jgi:hypothetical protein
MSTAARNAIVHESKESSIGADNGMGIFRVQKNKSILKNNIFIPQPKPKYAP